MELMFIALVALIAFAVGISLSGGRQQSGPVIIVNPSPETPMQGFFGAIFALGIFGALFYLVLSTVNVYSPNL